MFLNRKTPEAPDFDENRKSIDLICRSKIVELCIVTEYQCDSFRAVGSQIRSDTGVRKLRSAYCPKTDGLAWCEKKTRKKRKRKKEARPRHVRPSKQTHRGRGKKPRIGQFRPGWRWFNGDELIKERYMILLLRTKSFTALFGMWTTEILGEFSEADRPLTSTARNKEPKKTIWNTLVGVVCARELWQLVAPTVC